MEMEKNACVMRAREYSQTLTREQRQRAKEKLVAQFADAIVGQFMSVDNYVIFSVGKIRYGGETKTISFGILGHVFTFDADDIGKAMDKEQPVPDTMAV